MDKFILWFIVWVLLTLTTLSFLWINVFEIYKSNKKEEFIFWINSIEQKKWTWTLDWEEYLPTDWDVNDFDKQIKNSNKTEKKQKIEKNTTTNSLPTDFQDL